MFVCVAMFIAIYEFDGWTLPAAFCLRGGMRFE
jgi:hypothetical protein